MDIEKFSIGGLKETSTKISISEKIASNNNNIPL